MDQTLFYLINERWTSPALDLFMAAISNVEIWKPVIIALGLYALVFMGFKGRAFVFCLAITLTFADQFLVRTLKSAVDRRRPKQVQTVRMVQLERTPWEFMTLFQKPTIRFSDETDREQVRTLVSFRPRDGQRDHRDDLHALFPPVGLALFLLRGGDRLFANLPRRPLAE